MPPSLRLRKQKDFLIAAAAILAGSLANALLDVANIRIGSPFFFDSIFTAISGALFGPLAGALCGLSTHIWLEAFHGWDGSWILFVPCNMATGLIVGLFAKRGRLSTVTAAIACTVSVALANAVLGALIAYIFFGSVTTHPSDDLVTSFLLAGQSLFGASFWARIPVNLVDKGLAVTLAFIAARFIPWAEERAPRSRSRGRRLP
jgi:energy-coupling factor transport system substrate-specific component